MRHLAVVGATGGIGRAVVRHESGPGTRLSLVDVADEESIRTVAETARRAGAEDVAVMSSDLSSPAGIESLVSRLARRHDCLDALVLATGVTGPVAPIGQYSAEAFRHVLGVNLESPFLLLNGLVDLLTRSADASVVMVGSTSSIRGRAGLAGYVASKHGLLGLVRVAALDLDDTSVRVNAVLPGPVDTPLLASLEEEVAHSGGSLGRAREARRPARPEDIASTIGFLLSPQAAHVRGAGWVVDGAVTVG